MYNVRYYPDGNIELLAELAAGLYDTYEYPRLEFDKRTYLERVLVASSEDGMYACFVDDKPVAAVTVSPMLYDVHFNGTGRHVTNTVVLPGVDSRKVLVLLLRGLERGLGEEGGTWYSTTHRRDFYTLTTRYRRVNVKSI